MFPSAKRFWWLSCKLKKSFNAIAIDAFDWCGTRCDCWIFNTMNP